MKLKYVGPFDAVDIPDLGLEGVKHGATFEATGATAESLLEQVDNFVRVDAARSRAPKRKA